MTHLANVHFINYCTYCTKRAFFFLTHSLQWEKGGSFLFIAISPGHPKNTDDQLARKQLMETHVRLEQAIRTSDDESPSLEVVWPPEVVSLAPCSPSTEVNSISRSLPGGRCVCMTPCTCVCRVPDGGREREESPESIGCNGRRLQRFIKLL